MDGIQMPQGCRVTTSRQCTFYHFVPRNPWYSFDQPQKGERLSRPWSHPPSGFEHGTPGLGIWHLITTRPFSFQLKKIIFAKC